MHAWAGFRLGVISLSLLLSPYPPLSFFFPLLFPLFLHIIGAAAHSESGPAKSWSIDWVTRGTGEWDLRMGMHRMGMGMVWEGMGPAWHGARRTRHTAHSNETEKVGGGGVDISASASSVSGFGFSAVSTSPARSPLSSIWPVSTIASLAALQPPSAPLSLDLVRGREGQPDWHSIV